MDLTRRKVLLNLVYNDAALRFRFLFACLWIGAYASIVRWGTKSLYLEIFPGFLIMNYNGGVIKPWVFLEEL